MRHCGVAAKLLLRDLESQEAGGQYMNNKKALGHALP